MREASKFAGSTSTGPIDLTYAVNATPSSAKSFSATAPAATLAIVSRPDEASAAAGIPKSIFRIIGVIRMSRAIQLCDRAVIP